jgi:uncharacterized membrane protein YcaP (DUF421 family)
MDSKILTDMFHLGLPVLEKIIRPIIVYVFLIIGLRLAGKRELAQLNPFDLVVLLTLSNTVQNAIIGDDNSVTGGIIGAATLLFVNYLVVRLIYGHDKLDKLIEGDEDVLIDNGVIQMDKLKAELITMSELEVAAHRQGFASLCDVERAVLEPGGAVTFIAKKPMPEEARHQELLALIGKLSDELATIKKSLPVKTE